MTTLAEFLPTAAGLSVAELKAHAMVFGDAPYQALLEAQAERPGARHRAAPVQLTDGRWLLCADLLSEIGPRGLYSDGFALLPPALFAEVEVMPWDEAVALLPVPEPMEDG